MNKITTFSKEKTDLEYQHFLGWSEIEIYLTKNAMAKNANKISAAVVFLA